MSIVLQAFHTVAASLPKIQPGDLPQTGSGPNSVNSIRDILFPIIGGIALVVIVVSGFRYIVSAGDPQKAIKARNGVIYAMVGLAIALTADAIVAYVVNKVGR